MLAAILETDEPMVLAQLLSLATPGMRAGIEGRLVTLAPADAGEIRSLTDMQARIDELLNAGATEAAALYIDAEAKLTTAGRPRGREATQFRNRLRLAYMKQDWEAIAAATPPPLNDQMEQKEARETLRQFQGLAAITGPRADPAQAKAVFENLHRKRPSLGFANNWFAAAISDLLRNDIFALLGGDQARAGTKAIDDLERMVASLPGETRDDVLHANKALLLLALGEPAQALGSLSAVAAPPPAR